MKDIENIPHPVVPRSSTCAYHYREFGDIGASNGSNEFGAVLGNATFLGIGAHHEAADVLEEDEGYTTLGAELDEVRAFEGGFREEDAVVCEDTDLIAVNTPKAYRHHFRVSSLFQKPLGPRSKGEWEEGSPVTRVFP